MLAQWNRLESPVTVDLHTVENSQWWGEEIKGGRGRKEGKLFERKKYLSLYTFDHSQNYFP